VGRWTSSQRSEVRVQLEESFDFQALGIHLPVPFSFAGVILVHSWVKDRPKIILSDPLIVYCPNIDLKL